MKKNNEIFILVMGSNVEEIENKQFLIQPTTTLWKAMFGDFLMYVILEHWVFTANLNAKKMMRYNDICEIVVLAKQ